MWNPIDMLARFARWQRSRELRRHVELGFCITSAEIAAGRRSLLERLVLTDDGFVKFGRRDRVKTGPSEVQWVIRWDDIVEIAAWKRDLFAIDEIHWGFRRGGETTYLEIDEHMVDYEIVSQVASQHFGISLESWFSVVAFPAFATNFTTIWGKSLEAS